MLKSLSQSIKTKWKRALSGLLAVVTVAGMLPATAFAAGGTPATSSATTPVYAPTGDFEVNIAGATGWNSGSQPLTVYSTESGKTQITAIPASDGAAPIPFALLEDSGGERVKVGLAVDGGGNVTGWEGGKIEKTGWADKKDIFINLPDVLPGIAYNRDGGRQFSSRLSRYEYVVPGSYALAEQLALLQREAMTDGDTLVVCQSGQTVSVSRAKGGSDQLYQYALDGAVYPKYEDWTEYDTPDDTLAALSYELPRIIDRAYSVIPYTTLTELCARSIKKAPVKVSSASPTGGTGGLNPGSPGGQKPTTSNVDWSTDPERTFLRFTLIEFPEGVVKDIGNNDYNTWHVVGTPLNVVWGKGTYENWTAEQCRSRITWFNSSAMQYNGKGSNAAQMMAGGTGGVYAYDATSGYNQRWVTTADEFQKESGITDQQKEQMFHCNSSKWSSSWIDGDYTSMWGTDPQPVTPGNLYKVYKPNDAFLYLLGRLSENSSGAGWSKDDAIAKWSEYVHDASGNLRTKYRVIIETGGVFVDPDGLRRAYTLREMMAYSLYNSENGSKGDLLYDQSSTIRNMAQWMRQSKGQFLEYPLNGDGTPTGEELCSTNGYTEADSFVDSITKAAKIRDTIFTERRSYGLHILSPFNFERPEPTGTSLEVTKKADGSMPAGKTWSFTVTYTAGSPSNFTARKNNVDCTNQVTSTGSGLKFSLKADETIRIVFDADASFRFEVREDDSSQLTAITGTGGTADMATKKFTSSGSESKVTFTNGTTITEKKPVYLKLKKIAAADKKPLSAAEFSVYADSSCTGAPLAVMTTGSDGTASTSVPNIVEDGGSVTLYVKETRAPAGCTPLAAPIPVTCKAPDNSTQAGAAQVGPASGIENGNIPEPGKALLFKRDALTNTGVGPATFKFSSVTNGVYEFDTDEAGVLESVQWWDPTEAAGKYIKPGEYAVTELIPPPNYEPTTEVQQIKLELDANGNPIPAGPLVFKNLAKVGLKILKYDRLSHRPMSGVSFEIFRDGVSLGHYETNGSGEILLTGIEPGTYRAVEVDTGDDSHIKDTAPQEIELTAGCGVKELFFFNDVLPGMKLVKVDSADPSKTIPGAKFRIRAVDGSFGPQEFVTDSKGEIDLSKLPEGSYEVVEVECAGYVIDNAQRIIHLRANDTAQFVFTNTKKPGLRLVKTSADGTPLDGVTFKITRIEDASHSIDRTTQNGGEILVEGLEPGIYSVVETATLPDHVLDTTEYHVELSPGRTAELRLSNDKRPYLTIAKVEQGSNKPIPNTTFTVEGIDSDYRHDVTTGVDGTVTIQVDPGSYRITEKDVPEPYCLPEDEADRVQTVSLRPNDNKTISFQNSKKPLLTLSKIDADSQAPIPNTVLTVRALDGTYQDDWKTGSDGKVTAYVNPGVYEVTEKSVPSPYYLPDKDADRTQTITLSPGDEKTLTFRNRKAPELTIFKENSITSEPIEHAKFHITYTSNGEAAEAPATIDYGEVFTDARGEIRVHELGKRLYPGEFTITEVEPADGFQLKEPITQTVIIHGNESKTVRFQNTPLSALVVWKYDSVTGKPVEGCIFQVKYMSGTSGSGGTVIGTYKTGPSGSFTINRLKAGAYLVEELASDGDHVMDTAPQTAYISGKEQDVVQLYFGNSPKGAILLKKIDASTHEPLSDVEFFITDSKGTMLGDANGKFVTDSAGTILISNLDPGTTIVAKETRAKEGYLLDDVPQTITIQAGRTATLEFRNQPKGSVTLYKFSSADRRTPLEGVGFKITYADGRAVDNIGGKLSSNGIYYTDAEGQINISQVTGTLIFTEISSIPGYLIDENRKSQTIVVNPDDHQSVYFYNIPETTLIIEKYLETEAGEQPLKGVTFLVTDSSGAVIGSSNGEFISGEDGRIVIDGVAPGTTAIVREIKVPDGVVLDSTPKTIKIGDKGANTLRFVNQKTGYLVIRKLDRISKEPLANVEFELTYADGSFVDDAFGHLSSKGRFKTNDAGEIRVPVVGTVVVKELTPCPGYVMDEATRIQTVKVNPADTQTLVVYNEPLCSLTLTKKDAVTGKPVPNTEFTLKDGDGNILGKYTTGADGTVTVTGLIPNSTVVVVESKVPSNYVLDPTPRTIIVKNGSNSVSTGTAGGGSANVGGNSSAGGNDVTVENFPKVTLTIEKYLETESGEKPLKGATFLITDQTGAVIGSSNGEYTTDDTGRIVIPNLEPGTTVTVREIKVPDGVVLDSTPRSILIKAGEQGQTLRLVNKATGWLVIKKLDKLTGKPLVGVEFKLSYASGEYVDDAYGHLSSLGLYTTDQNGEIRVPVVGTVIVEETKTLPGYTIDPGTQRQVVTVKPADTQTLKVYNTPGTTLTIQKLVTGTKDKPLAGVEFLITDSSGAFVGPNNGIYRTDEYGRITLSKLKPGTVITAKETKTVDGFVLDGTPKSIEIKEGEAQMLTFYNAPIGGLELIKVSEADKTQRIKGVTFEIRKMDGALVDTVTTDKTGRVHVDLDAGDYYCVEIEAAEGFKIDSTPHYFTIRDNETTTLTVTNAPFSGIILHKIDSVTGLGIYNVKFLVYDQSKNPIGEYSTDDSGYIYIDDLTVQGKGKLFIRELEAAPGYELDKQYKTVYVQPGKTIEIEWENTPITGQFQIYKYAAEYNEVTGTQAGTPLQGAVYEISEARSGKVVDYITTDARGVAASKPLPLGRYKIVEVTAPAYWQVSGKTFDETLEYSGQIIKVSDYDKPSNLGVTITKRGNAEALSGSSMRYDITVANTSNVPLSNFYWHDRIPTDAARATVLTTGTYSARLNYRVLYKTNYTANYQVLASNLLTTNSYSFSLNAIPTQAGEYVTDVYFDFGKVPVGFQSVASPTLTVVVSGTAANGYQLINRADVGGKYQGTWQTAQATWVTTIRKLTPTVPLPKTGY